MENREEGVSATFEGNEGQEILSARQAQTTASVFNVVPTFVDFFLIGTAIPLLEMLLMDCRCSNSFQFELREGLLRGSQAWYRCTKMLVFLFERKETKKETLVLCCLPAHFDHAVGKKKLVLVHSTNLVLSSIAAR